MPFVFQESNTAANCKIAVSEFNGVLTESNSRNNDYCLFQWIFGAFIEAKNHVTALIDCDDLYHPFFFAETND